jgi:hypothetical protein
MGATEYVPDGGVWQVIMYISPVVYLVLLSAAAFWLIRYMVTIRRDVARMRRALEELVTRVDAILKK